MCLVTLKHVEPKQQLLKAESGEHATIITWIHLLMIYHQDHIGINAWEILNLLDVYIYILYIYAKLETIGTKDAGFNTQVHQLPI